VVTPEITPDMIARIDQQYEQAKAGLMEAVADARLALEEHGPAKAAALVSVMHVELTDGDPHLLGGMVGLALVELARREVGDA
jgi:hypothetical protein